MARRARTASPASLISGTSLISYLILSWPATPTRSHNPRTDQLPHRLVYDDVPFTLCISPLLGITESSSTVARPQLDASHTSSTAASQPRPCSPSFHHDQVAIGRQTTI